MPENTIEFVVISRGDDEPHVDFLARAELDEMLVDDWTGYAHIDTCLDLMEFPSNSVLIIKGRPVIPTPVKIATKYTIE